jgi:DNA-binding MarR family transcriptional regulator
LDPLDDHLIHLLRQAQLGLSEREARALEPLSITPREATVLMTVEGGEPLSQLQVGERMRVDRTTMVALVDRLEDKGLLERRRDPADRRRNVVVLTRSGRTKLRNARAATEKVEHKLLTDAERWRLRKLLRGLAG